MSAAHSNYNNDGDNNDGDGDGNDYDVDDYEMAGIPRNCPV